jgi:hypothetical protein
VKEVQPSDAVRLCVCVCVMAGLELLDLLPLGRVWCKGVERGRDRNGNRVSFILRNQ